MQKIAVIFLGILIVLGALGWFLHSSKGSDSSSSSSISQLSPTIVQKPQETVIFVPYWTLSSNSSFQNYNTAIYFGVTANKNGIDKTDPGYKNIQRFLHIAKDPQKKYLTVRLTDPDINSYILDTKDLQQKIIDESIKIANQNGFDGIVLDYELPALSFTSVIQHVTNFYSDFSKSVKNNNLKFAITVYGDTFYRDRPYDVKTLQQSTDMVFIMAYDFHKARGNPGPNFPLTGKDTYGYDFKAMIQDFIKEVPKEKLGVIFGMFGYDWTVDAKNESVGNGKPLSFVEIKNIFLDSCAFQSCKVQKDIESAETKVTYLDNNQKNHEVWFEDKSSSDQKTDYLKTQGINYVGYWAYSYF